MKDDVPLAQALARRCGTEWPDSAAATSIVRTAFIDTAACILAGRAEEATRVVGAWAASHATASAGTGARVLFGDTLADSGTAALVNGVAAHALDFDDVGLAGHPSAVLVPALLAQQEAHGGDGPALVQAYARGFAVWGELQRRMQVPLHARGWHPSPVFGVVAAAAAVGALRRLDEARLAHALGIAASFAGGVIANFGTMTKPLHIGRAAQGGIQAVELALAGLDASPEALDHPAGLLVALAGDAARVDVASSVPADFEDTLVRQRPGLKKYPVCYALHRVTDGVLDLSARHRFAPGDVASVRATLSDTAASVLRHHDPRTVTEARFSMEFALATALVRGRLGIAEVAPGTLQDPQVRALMPRVATATVPAGCPLEPSFALHDQVAVTLRDGTVLDSGPIRFARGHAELPLDDAQLRDKLFACAGPGAEVLAQHLLARIDRLFA